MAAATSNNQWGAHWGQALHSKALLLPRHTESGIQVVGAPPLESRAIPSLTHSHVCCTTPCASTTWLQANKHSANKLSTALWVAPQGGAKQQAGGGACVGCMQTRRHQTPFAQSSAPKCWLATTPQTPTQQQHVDNLSSALRQLQTPVQNQNMNTPARHRCQGHNKHTHQSTLGASCT